jgi:hypothetical protein
VLKYNQPNPLNVFGLRQLEHRPPHFTSISFDIRVGQKLITDWIWENLEGRFWIGETYYPTENGSVTFQKSVSFEHAAEASMFALMLDQINIPRNYN